jgi:hypothetical protein
MTLATEALLLYALILYLHLPVIFQIVVIVLFIIGRAGFVNYTYGPNRTFRL